MDIVCSDQAEWIRGRRRVSAFGEEGEFASTLYTETERQNTDLLASINEYGFLTFYGQMGECKYITADKDTVSKYGERFLDAVNPVSAEAFEAMSAEDQKLFIDKSYRLLGEELVSLKLTEAYWIGGITHAVAAWYLQQEFRDDQDIRVMIYPFGKYVWECAKGQNEAAETVITEKHTTLTLVTKTKGEHTSSSPGIHSFPHITAVQRVLNLLRERKNAAKLKREIMQGWCIVMIDCSKSCVNLSSRVLKALTKYVSDTYPQLDGDGSRRGSPAARRILSI